MAQAMDKIDFWWVTRNNAPDFPITSEKVPFIQVDGGYDPAEGADWDVDEWEKMNNEIFFSPTRQCWKAAYSAARKMVRDGVSGRCLHVFVG